ncbi:Cobalt transport protein CbiN [compost metagenome]
MNRMSVNLMLFLVVLVLLTTAFMLGSPHAGDEDRFTGSDAKATALVEASHPQYQLWFQPVFQPASSEVESGLFAVQAAIGGMIVGGCLTALKSRRKLESALAAASATGSGTS